MFAAIEGGGTKFRCAIGTGIGDIREQVYIPTTNPGDTIATAVAFFRTAQQRHGRASALGLACFGPLGLNPGTAGFGSILDTPKPGWSQVPIAGLLHSALEIPIEVDTDVNGAALAELEQGAGRGLESLAYVTVGTGIGGGIIVHGKRVGGLFHPELGHLRIPRHPLDTDFAGHCSFHGDCLEGLASGPAMQARWHSPAEALPQGHPGWEIEADYLASLCVNITCTVSPQMILLGGGVMACPGLLDKVRLAFARQFNDYLPIAARTGGLDNYIRAPGLGNDAGLAGAFSLAGCAATRATT